jgi:hypothetical protein
MAAPAPAPAEPRARVLSVEVFRSEVDFGHPTAGAELAEAYARLTGDRARPPRLPFAPERVAVVVDGVPSAVANALRRALLGEMRGFCLDCDEADVVHAETDDPFMSDFGFLRTRLRMLPLNPDLAPEALRALRLELAATNPGPTPRVVFSGDLVVRGAPPGGPPLFNPIFQLAFLQPGMSLRVQNIRVAEGRGVDDDAFCPASRAVSRPLDLEEHPREATHSADGAFAHQSGFVLSSSVADPRRHEVSVWLRAVPARSSAAVAYFARACEFLARRYRELQAFLEAARGRPTHREADAHYIATADADGRTKGVLTLRGETLTVGHALARVVYELKPDVSSVAAEHSPHLKEASVAVCHAVAEPGDIAAIFVRAAAHAAATFDAIRLGVLARARA